MIGRVSAVTEEYLEVIYRLQQRSRVARTSDIVKFLQVVPGTVTNTIERLERKGLVIHKPYKGIKLTKRGYKIALDVIRRHRLSERLLTDILNVKWYKAHTAACCLEHDITGEIVESLERILGYPKTCPHGNPIPTGSGKILEEDTENITDLRLQEKGVIVKIAEEESELLRQIDSLDLKPGKSVKVIKTSVKGPVTVEIGEVSYTISHKVAALVKVKKEMGSGS